MAIVLLGVVVSALSHLSALAYRVVFESKEVGVVVHSLHSQKADVLMEELEQEEVRVSSLHNGLREEGKIASGFRRSTCMRRGTGGSRSGSRSEVGSGGGSRNIDINGGRKTWSGNSLIGVGMRNGRNQGRNGIDDRIAVEEGNRLGGVEELGAGRAGHELVLVGEHGQVLGTVGGIRMRAGNAAEINLSSLVFADGISILGRGVSRRSSSSRETYR